MDEGLLVGLAEGIKSGVASYQDAKRTRQEQDALKRQMQREDEAQALKQKEFSLREKDAAQGLLQQRNEGLLRAAGVGKIGSYDAEGNLQLQDDPEYWRRQRQASRDPLESALKQAQIEKVKTETAQLTKTGQAGKQLAPDKVLLVQEGKGIPTLLEDIKKTMETSRDMFGPVAGRIGAMNPYNEKAKTTDAQLRTAAQSFGRYMEGGVLRKEDEEKYRRMFPLLTDTPEVAANKLALVERSLKTKLAGDMAALKASGYDVSGLGEVAAIPELPSILTTPQGGANMIAPAQAAAQGPTQDEILAEIQRRKLRKDVAR